MARSFADKVSTRPFLICQVYGLLPSCEIARKRNYAISFKYSTPSSKYKPSRASAWFNFCVSSIEKTRVPIFNMARPQTVQPAIILIKIFCTFLGFIAKQPFFYIEKNPFSRFVRHVFQRCAAPSLFFRFLNDIRPKENLVLRLQL